MYSVGGVPLEQGTRMLFFSSFSHFSSPFLQAYSLSISTSLIANLKPFLYFCPLLPFSARPVPSPKITVSQQWWEEAMGLAHTLSPQPLPRLTLVVSL